MSTLRLRQTCPKCDAVHYATQCHVCKRPVIPADELAELKEIHRSLPHLGKKPWSEIETDAVIIGCLRNTLRAQRRARAERAHVQPENFELVS
jgi:hypothetical protein